MPLPSRSLWLSPLSLLVHALAAGRQAGELAYLGEAVLCCSLTCGRLLQKITDIVKAVLNGDATPYSLMDALGTPYKANKARARRGARCSLSAELRARSSAPAAAR